MSYKFKITAVLFLLITALVLPSCAGGDVVTTTAGTDTEKVTETQTEQVTDTETETETETEAETEPEPELPYDNTHAYIFAGSDKKSNWITQGAEVSREFNVLKMVPTNNDPMIYCSFDES